MQTILPNNANHLATICPFPWPTMSFHLIVFSSSSWTPPLSQFLPNFQINHCLFHQLHSWNSVYFTFFFHFYNFPPLTHQARFKISLRNISTTDLTQLIEQNTPRAISTSYLPKKSCVQMVWSDVKIWYVQSHPTFLGRSVT